jgi:hypothetical protein
VYIFLHSVRKITHFFKIEIYKLLFLKELEFFKRNGTRVVPFFVLGGYYIKVSESSDIFLFLKNFEVRMKQLSTIFAAFLLLCGGISVSAQTNRFENGTEGTEFWFSFPPNWIQSGNDNSNTLKIYVACEVSVPCTLEIPGLGITQIKMTKAGDVIEFTLRPEEGQPYIRADGRGTALSEEQVYNAGKGRGIHVFAEVPITVSTVSRITYTTDSFIALPVSSLGTEYIVASFKDVTARFPNQHLPSQTVIVAAHDSTVVKFTLGGSPGTKTVGGMVRGESKSFYLLKKGDLVMFSNGSSPDGQAIDPMDLSGSKIESDKPVAVISGNQCAYVPYTVACCCDFMMEMELPTNTWGTKYHVPYFPKRKKNAQMKIFAKNPQTSIYREGSNTLFHKLTTGGGYEGSGYYEGPVFTDGSAPLKPITYKADGPINITLFNNSQSHDEVSSDPFQLVLTPIEQYQKEIIFNTPGIKGGQGYPENYVALVFEGNMDGSMPDSLDFGTVVNGEIVWESISTKFGPTSEPFAMWPGDDFRYFQKNITLPGDGVYRIRSSKPFAAYLYGFGSYDSYGQPTSLITNHISENDQIAPLIAVIKDDSTTVKLTAKDTGAIQSKVSRVFLNPTASSNFRLKTDEFVAGRADNINTVAEVIDKTKNATAEIVVVDRAGNHSIKTITYLKKLMAVFSKNDINFGIQPAGLTVSKKIQMENTGNAPGTLISYSIPKSPVFKLIDWPDFPLTLDPTEDLDFTVSFESMEEGNFSDTITFTTDFGDVKVALSAKVIMGNLATTGYNFGKTTVGKEAYGKISLSNSGTADLSIYFVEKPKTAVFTLQAPEVIVIQPDKTFEFPVTFMSNVPGHFKDTVVVKSDEGTTWPIELTATAEPGTSVEAVYDPSFNISPNPATGFTTINLPAFKSQNPLLKIYDARGNVVTDLTQKTEAGITSFTFDTRTLPNGAYFVRFTDGGYSLLRTFVVNN